MATASSRRVAITLYATPQCPYNHRTRFVLAEKGVDGYAVVELKPDETSEDLLALNPENTLPTFVDRDVVVSEPCTTIEYLDERYPHPPLMPVDPASRAGYRQALRRMERDLYALMEELDLSTPGQARKLRKHLRENLAVLASHFSGGPYMGADFSLLDCTFAPILWRLRHYRIDLPEKADRKLQKYARALFARPAFQSSLTAVEAEMPQ